MNVSIVMYVAAPYKLQLLIKHCLLLMQRQYLIPSFFGLKLLFTFFTHSKPLMFYVKNIPAVTSLIRFFLS